jgi:ATP-dependent DNA helicase RecQ
MRASLEELEELVRTSGEGVSGAGFAALTLADPLLDRLVRAVSGNNRPGRTGTADLAVLIRQWLVRAADRGPSPSVRLPRTEPWPNADTWHAFGCTSVLCDDSTQLVSLSENVPAWLQGRAADAIGAACRQEERRPGRTVPCDPDVAELVPDTQGQYLSAGQREAVRSAFLAAPGSTVLICLPTGAGKTLAFQAPALAGVARQKVTVVVVPTVALARDQERRFRELLSARKETKHLAAGVFAYHSGLTEAERMEFFHGLGEGTVPIVFTSPEAALGALRRSLLAAARAGRLGLFAVDEAHMVSQWGDSFRPHFQLVAGLRDTLLEEARSGRHKPFVTLLLTATLTEESAYALEQAFGRQGPLQVVAEPRLRDEPAIVVHSAEDAQRRGDLLLEALRYLPRPLILYTTQPEDAQRLKCSLQDHGYQRVRSVVGGDMSTNYGEEVLELWGKREVDVIVATSAFGLGVDQSDVRAVVHAWQPESLDRYYQEVGRSGRDGRASVALLLWTLGDAKVAEYLASDPAISIERGLQRWNAMLHSSNDRHVRGSTTIMVRTDARPPGITEGSDLNVSWNLRTLVLMSRAGLIRFTCVPPVEMVELPGESQDQFELRRRRALEEAAVTAAVEVLVDDVSERRTWLSRVERVREDLRKSDLKTIEDVKRLLRGEDAGQFFTEIYTIPRLGLYPAPRGVEPTIVGLRDCGARVNGKLEELLQASADDAGRLFVRYAEPHSVVARDAWRRDPLGLALVRAAQGGILEFAIPPKFFDARRWRDMSAGSPTGFLCRVSAAEVGGPLPRLTVLRGEETLESTAATLEVAACPHVIFYPDHLIDPLHPHRRIQDSWNSMTLEAFLGRLIQ